MQYAQWNGPSVTKPNPENSKNCSSKCAYDCAQLQLLHNTKQNSSDNLLSYLQTNITAQATRHWANEVTSMRTITVRRVIEDWQMQLIRSTSSHALNNLCSRPEHPESRSTTSLPWRNGQDCETWSCHRRRDGPADLHVNTSQQLLLSKYTTTQYNTKTF